MCLLRLLERSVRTYPAEPLWRGLLLSLLVKQKPSDKEA